MATDTGTSLIITEFKGTDIVGIADDDQGRRRGRIQEVGREVVGESGRRSPVTEVFRGVAHG
jgi:hypothetical protein